MQVLKPEEGLWLHLDLTLDQAVDVLASLEVSKARLGSARISCSGGRCAMARGGVG